jgi:phosphomevalonate kinase
MVTAPGKLLLLGEYAVLEGFPAIVAAVNRRASGQFVPAREPESELVAIAVRHAAHALGPNRVALPGGSVLVDTSAFSLNGTKIGIGSSAATAVVSVGAVMEMAGVSVADSSDLVFDVALAAHRAAQGGLGSGADVAAAVYGGILQYTRAGAGPASVRRLPALQGAELVVFATGIASSTVDCLKAVASFAKQRRDSYRQLLPPIADAVIRFEGALSARHTAELIASIATAHAAMDALGQAAGVPIVTPLLAHAALLAAEVGGAAKPSGAGGGDVGVAFLPDPDAADEFRTRARAIGLGILDLFVDPTGVSRL